MRAAMVTSWSCPTAGAFGISADWHGQALDLQTFKLVDQLSRPHAWPAGLTALSKSPVLMRICSTRDSVAVCVTADLCFTPVQPGAHAAP